MSAPTGEYSVTYRDYTNETSVFAVHTVPLTAANFAATGAALQTLGTATNALSLGNPARSKLTAETNVISAAAATDVNAQVERKWRVFYHDTVTNDPYRLEIPCADLTANLLPNSDRANPASTEWAAWITAFEAVARSENNNPVEFDYAMHVGKNL